MISAVSAGGSEGGEHPDFGEERADLGAERPDLGAILIEGDASPNLLAVRRAD